MRAHLGRATRCATDGRPEELVDAVASFHHGLVRLHPFHCANQCLSMNLVNSLLCSTHGAGIPHLVLDHLALRLSPAAYLEAFRRAVGAFMLTDDSPAQRLNILQQRKQRSFDLIERVAACGSQGDLDTLLAEDPEAARWSLLSRP